jgi:hypothetical protein
MQPGQVDITNHLFWRIAHVYYLTWSSKDTGEWVVEAVDEEGGGEVCLTTFSGPGAEERAREYVAWKRDAPPYSSAA